MTDIFDEDTEAPTQPLTHRGSETVRQGDRGTIPMSPLDPEPYSGKGYTETKYTGSRAELPSCGASWGICVFVSLLLLLVISAFVVCFIAAKMGYMSFMDGWLNPLVELLGMQ